MAVVHDYEVDEEVNEGDLCGVEALRHE